MLCVGKTLFAQKQLKSCDADSPQAKHFVRRINEKGLAWLTNIMYGSHSNTNSVLLLFELYTEKLVLTCVYI